VLRVACGSHTLALAEGGEIYAWGNGKHGQLGLGARHPELSPRRVDALAAQRVIGIACGDFHSLALTSANEVYTWGCGSSGELGHGAPEHQTLPRRMAGMDGLTLTFASCGASHTVMLVAAPYHLRHR